MMDSNAKRVWGCDSHGKKVGLYKLEKCKKDVTKCYEVEFAAVRARISSLQKLGPVLGC
jgi:hypothetical protein